VQDEKAMAAIQHHPHSHSYPRLWRDNALL